VLLFKVLKMEHRTLYTLGKCSTTELHPQSYPCSVYSSLPSKDEEFEAQGDIQAGGARF
jgi:hypothetical protein